MRATLKCRLRKILHRGALILLSGLVVSRMDAAEPPKIDFAARAKSAFESAQKTWEVNSHAFEENVNLARTAFDLAEFAKTLDERERIAHIGIRAGRAAVEASPNAAAGHYYLAMNLGQLARTKMLGALKLLGEMEAEWLAALALDPKYDHAGPDRSLGILYLEAPSWASVGDKNKARAHLERAVTLFPKHPENLLCLMEAQVKWKDWGNLEKRMKEFEVLLPEARRSLSGEQWADEWADWDKRWESVKSKAKKR